MFNLPEKYTEIDGFRIPSDKAEEYKRIKARMIREAETFFHTFRRSEERKTGRSFRRRYCRLFFYW